MHLPPQDMTRNAQPLGPGLEAAVQRRVLARALAGLPPHARRQVLAAVARQPALGAASAVSAGHLPAEALADAWARETGLPRIDPAATPIDPSLVDSVGAAACLALGAVPLRRVGGRTLVAVADATALPQRAATLARHIGPVEFAIAPAAAIAETLARIGAAGLRDRAETRVAPAFSCRTWNGTALRAALAALALAAGLALVLAPQTLFVGLTLWCALTLVATVALKAAALAAAVRRARAEAAAATPLPAASLPAVSLIVPLFREAGIAPRLLRRLGQIDYPRDLLDVLLVVEEVDTETRAALLAAGLPPWMRVLTVPDAPVRTKPRALNYALDFARGEIIGIYDAEDAPQRDQIRRVAHRFATGPADLGCVQGVLDYYNPRTNWMARCFTLEYAAWFRVIMPGLARLGIPLPLGGTTLFLRRAALQRAGAWDAHNVTEDADLGIRLARHGFRTEMLDSTTGEEANCRLRPWVRQRSRWIKGHMITWAVHMRNPVRLWRDLGPRGFLGYQALFVGAQTQFLAAPLLWSFWLIPLGVPHPVAAALPPGALAALFALFLTAEAVNLALGIAGGRRTAHSGLWAWAVTLPFYFPLAGVAAWRALREVFTNPWYWAKTSHGHFDAAPATAPLPVPEAVTEGYAMAAE
jgi:cellulose synthase/poly-beta-1,6-N-acetylglucosamine synthase-like glycosyltransferase